MLRVSGTIDENADLSLLRDVHGRVRIDLSELRRINSFGVRTWRDAIHSVPADAAVELERCPTPFIDQVNMLADFVGNAKVVSFSAPYACDDCDHETDALLDVEALRGNDPCELPPPPKCPNCDIDMTPDFLEELYLSFLAVER